MFDENTNKAIQKAAGKAADFLYNLDVMAAPKFRQRLNDIEPMINAIRDAARAFEAYYKAKRLAEFPPKEG